MAEIWKGLVRKSASDADIVQLGKNAYARKKSQMYSTMQAHAVDILVEEGYGYLLDDSQPFYKHIEAVRALPENIVAYEGGYAEEDVAGGERVGSMSM